MTMTQSRLLGVVAIGRNEGERLSACLRSVVGRVAQVVYVDSGSTDQSIVTAESLGVHVVQLDMSLPFTAARARNEGFRVLRMLRPDIQFIQFVDGDCEVVAGWLEAACAFLSDHQDFAVACGRRRERYPDRSVYNKLCDIEWDTPVGEAKSCGGDAMMRIDAFLQVDGYRASLIAGEEPELCVRLRARGWRIFRLGAEMTLHDADMKRFGQWWKRSMRAGYAFAEGAHLHGALPERHWVRENRSAFFWAGFLPMLSVVLMVFSFQLGIWVLALYPVQWARLVAKSGECSRANIFRGLFLILGKFPEFFGAIKFAANRLLCLRPVLIEYK